MRKKKKQITPREQIRRKAQSYSMVTGTPIDPVTNRPVIGFSDTKVKDAPIDGELIGCSIYDIDILSEK